MKIKKVVLENFMNHVSSSIELDDYFTCIIGSNDTGKSTIFYAIRWFMTNEPKGDSIIYRKEGTKAKYCSVSLHMEDGSIYRKIRKKGVTLFDSPTSGKEWGKAGLPKEIADAVKITSHTFGNNTLELNYSFQLDQPFLIAENPSVGASVISTFAGTDIIDITCKDVESENRSIVKERNELSETATKLLIEVEKYDYVEDTRALHTSISDVFDNITANMDFVNKAKKLAQAHEKICTESNFLYKKVKAIGNIFTTTIFNIENLEKLHSRMISFIKCNEKYTKAAIKEAYNSKILSVLHDINKCENLTSVSEKNKLRLELKKLGMIYANAYDYINICRRKLDTLNIVESNKEYLDLVSNKSKDYTVVKSFINKLKYINKLINESSKKIIAVSKNNHTLMINSYAETAYKHEHISKFLESMRELTDTINKLDSAVKEKNSELNELKIELESIWDEVDICPLCGTTLKEK